MCGSFVESERIAREIYALVGAGESVPADLPRALAASVLELPTARLALAVLAGGPHTLDRALELCAAVLDGAAVERKAAG